MKILDSWSPKNIDIKKYIYIGLHQRYRQYLDIPIFFGRFRYESSVSNAETATMLKRKKPL
jgi:hypothetical protein